MRSWCVFTVVRPTGTSIQHLVLCFPILFCENSSSFSVFRGDKGGDLEVREKASRHVGEALALSSETEQTVSAHHCRLVAGRPSPLSLQCNAIPPLPATVMRCWPTPDESEAVHLASLETLLPWEAQGTVAFQPMWAAALIVRVIDRSTAGGCCPCLHNEQMRTWSLLAAFRLKKRFLWGFYSETN